uniref:Uncharacterized protein n=1 Tax=Opuntia streptacantha TaxID=393608 RepID=A0A7C9FE48_OPUST
MTTTIAMKIDQRGGGRGGATSTGEYGRGRHGSGRRRYVTPTAAPVSGSAPSTPPRRQPALMTVPPSTSADPAPGSTSPSPTTSTPTLNRTPTPVLVLSHQTPPP